MAEDKIGSSFRKETLDRLQKLVYQNKKLYYGCVQSLQAAVQEIFGMKDENVYRSAS